MLKLTKLYLLGAAFVGAWLGMTNQHIVLLCFTMFPRTSWRLPSRICDPCGAAPLLFLLSFRVSVAENAPGQQGPSKLSSGSKGTNCQCRRFQRLRIAMSVSYKGQRGPNTLPNQCTCSHTIPRDITGTSSRLIWLQQKFQQPQVPKEQVQHLLIKSLWYDHDRFLKTYPYCAWI